MQQGHCLIPQWREPFDRRRALRLAAKSDEEGRTAAGHPYLGISVGSHSITELCQLRVQLQGGRF
jgi:hypothetical protein